MAGYGIAALSGLLSGLSGIPKGLEAGANEQLQRDRLDETKRQFDAGRAGIDTTSIGIPGLTPKELIPGLVALNQKKEDAARKLALGEGLSQQVREAGTSTGMAPGASVEMPQPGGLMTPPAPGPMPTMTQKVVKPEFAALAKLMPMLSQLDPGGTAKGVMEHFAPPKPTENRLVSTDKPIYDPATKQWIQPPPGPPPRPKIELRAGAGDTFAITTDPVTGEPVGQPRPVGIGAPESKGAWGRSDPEAQVNLEHTTPGQSWYGKLPPGSLAWRQRYNDLARQVTVPQGGTTWGAGTGLGGPPAPAIDPTVPLDQQPTVRDAGAKLRGAMDAANGLPGVPPPSGGTPAGPRPLIERPPSAADAAHYVHKTTLNPPPVGTTLSQIQQSGEYVQMPAAGIGAVKQLKTVKTMLDEAEEIITRRADLFPPQGAMGGGTGVMGRVLDNASVAQAWATHKAGSKTDADVGRLTALNIGLPSAVKSFGDTGNVAVAERAISKDALGLGPSTRESALARVHTVRDLVNSGATAAGFPSLVGGSSRGAAARTTPPSGGQTVSRRSPGYQKARQSGLSDQQIQQRFGVTLTD